MSLRAKRNMLVSYADVSMLDERIASERSGCANAEHGEEQMALHYRPVSLSSPYNTHFIGAIS